MKGIAPFAQLCFALAQKWADEALKSLRQSGIRDVALVLVELARCKKAAWRHQGLMELIDDGGLADTGVSGNEHQLRPTAGYDAIKGSEQSINLSISSVQFLGNQQMVWRVVFGKREFVDTAPSFPISKTAPKITRHAGRCLIALFSGF